MSSGLVVNFDGTLTADGHSLLDLSGNKAATFAPVSPPYIGIASCQGRKCVERLAIGRPCVFAASSIQQLEVISVTADFIVSASEESAWSINNPQFVQGFEADIAKALAVPVSRIAVKTVTDVAT